MKTIRIPGVRLTRLLAAMALFTIPACCGPCPPDKHPAAPAAKDGKESVITRAPGPHQGN